MIPFLRMRGKFTLALRALFPLQIEGDESDEGGDEAESEADAQEDGPARGGRGGGGEAGGVAATLAPTAPRGQGGCGRVGWQSCNKNRDNPGFCKKPLVFLFFFLASPGAMVGVAVSAGRAANKNRDNPWVL